MSDIAIKVENLSKSYLVGHNTPHGESYTALRDVIARNAKNFVRTTRDMLHGKSIVQGDEVEEFWALKDVSFEIKQGDRVGIIGRNGAGKSTLLKILSRITEPTKGRIQINGRVASLLEVGTGFHPELTGRENIFLNGAILGMSRKEIQRKFDEIVDFAEIEKFLDTPVKRYSSGMYVRLAFAVAAHLEPEILIVDEVLAVGDAQFQKKCLGKMEDVASQGRTVLFVSHNMGAVRNLCDTGILLSQGKASLQGDVDLAIAEYLKPKYMPESKKKCHKSSEAEQIFSVASVDKNFFECHSFYLGDFFSLRIELIGLRQNVEYQLSFIIRNSSGVNIYHCMSTDRDYLIKSKSEVASVVASFRDLRLYPGEYFIDDLWLADSNGVTLDILKNCHKFTVLDAGKLVVRKLEAHAGIVLEIPEWTEAYDNI